MTFQIPNVNWTILPLRENYTISEYIKDGSQVRLWVRATDVMGNVAVDYTEVYIDNTPPRVAGGQWIPNTPGGIYTYTARYE